MKKVKVYDLNKFFIKQENKQTFDMNKAVIFVGENGACIFDDEGCGFVLKSDTEEFDICLNDYDKDQIGKKIYIMPQYSCSITIKELVDNAEYKEMELKVFLHKHDYNSRCLSNFNEVLRTINKIGLKASDYI